MVHSPPLLVSLKEGKVALEAKHEKRRSSMPEPQGVSGSISVDHSESIAKETTSGASREPSYLQEQPFPSSDEHSNPTLDPNSLPQTYRGPSWSSQGHSLNGRQPLAADRRWPHGWPGAFPETTQHLNQPGFPLPVSGVRLHNFTSDQIALGQLPADSTRTESATKSTRPGRRGALKCARCRKHKRGQKVLPGSGSILIPGAMRNTP